MTRPSPSWRALHQRLLTQLSLSPLYRLSRAAPAIYCGLPVTALCGMVASASLVAVPLIVDQVVESIGLGRAGSGTGARMSPMFALALTVVLVGAVASYATYRRMYTAAETAASQIRSALMASLLQRLGARARPRSGDAVAMLTVDIEIVARFMRTLGVLAVLNVGQMLVAVLLLLFYSWPLVAGIVLCVLPAWGLAKLVRSRALRAFSFVRFRLGMLLASLTEYVRYEPRLRHLGARGFVEGRVRAQLREYRSGQKRAELLSAGMTATIEVWAALSLATSLGVGAWLLSERWISVGQLVAAVFLVQLLTGPVQALAEMLNFLQNATAAAARLLDCIQPSSVSRSANRARIYSQNREFLRFEDVWHRYDAEASFSLRGATFGLRSGTTTALVGVSGSGKSTIARLMAGVLEPDSGRIEVAGRLFGTATLVPEDVQLFHGSLRHNLSYPGPAQPDDVLARALDQLSLTGWMTGFADGLDTDVDAEPLGLLDRQRVAAVRALLARPGLLVFDESLSAMTTDEALELCAALRAAIPGVCIVIITHSPCLAHRCDEVVVLSDGLVVGQGAADVLVETCAQYRALTEGFPHGGVGEFGGDHASV
ncbi:ABC transporter ATP-binding protein [Saccharopolyspora taberi]|uniref:ABC transporter ATP-binding protein n=1 Tax=Saccharopolyspora taberi TaxID=60895 RepID=A0ABN3VEV8_9PSEU